MKNVRIFALLSFLAVGPVLLVWLPFLLRFKDVLGVPIPSGGMQVVAANYDGPLYIAIAKSLYSLEYIAANFSFPLPLEYYAAHFPMYPLLVRLLALPVGYPWGMLAGSLVGSIISIHYFYFLAREHVSENKALWLSLVFAVFPGRWLIVRSVGSPEPLFIGAILGSIYHFGKKQYWLAAFWGVLAQLTKSPGILLFVAYVSALTLPRLKDLATNHNFVKWVKTLEYKAYPILLIPLSLLALFYFYSIKFNDFFAYFNSGDNIHLFFPPFQIFNYSQPWVNTYWLEEIVFIYLLGLVGLVRLIRKKLTTFAWFTGIFIFVVFFISHRDVMRYALPVVPFILLAFSKELTSKEFKIILVVLIVPIYLFALSFISNNVMSISDWGPLL